MEGTIVLIIRYISIAVPFILGLGGSIIAMFTIYNFFSQEDDESTGLQLSIIFFILAFVSIGSSYEDLALMYLPFISTLVFIVVMLFILSIYYGSLKLGGLFSKFITGCFCSIFGYKYNGNNVIETTIICISLITFVIYMFINWKAPLDCIHIPLFNEAMGSCHDYNLLSPLGSQLETYIAKAVSDSFKNLIPFSLLAIATFDIFSVFYESE